MTEHNDPLLDILEAAEEGVVNIPPVVLRNGFMVTQAYVQDNGPMHYQDGLHRFSGVVLGTRIKSKGFHSYATWSTFFQDDLWECVGGDYFDDLDLARFNFGLKLKRNCWGATLRALKMTDG